MSDTLTIHPQTTLVIPKIRVEGGRETTREEISHEIDGVSETTEARVRTLIPDVEERRRADKIAGEAIHAIRRVATRTLIGYLCPADRLPLIDREIADVRARTAAHNARAQYARVEVGYLSIPIAISLGPEAARALADHVRGELTQLRDALRAGEIARARAIMLPTRAGNIDQLAVGVQAEAIRFALDECTQRLVELRRRIKGDGSISEAPESAGRSLDLTMIESAIGLFTYTAPALTGT